MTETEKNEHLNILLNDVHYILETNYKKFIESKELQDVFNQHLCNFLDKALINVENFDIILKAITKIPHLAFMLNFSNQSDFFEKVLSALFSADNDYINSFNSDSTMKYFIQTNYSAEWFNEYKRFLTKDVLLNIKNFSSLKNRRTLFDLLDLFEENYENKEDFIKDIHNVCNRNGNILLNEKTIKKNQKYLETIFNDPEMRQKLIRNEIHYSNNGENKADFYAKHFITEDDLTIHIKNNKENIIGHTYKLFFKRFNDLIGDELFEEIAVDFLEKTYKSRNSYSQNNDFKYLQENVKERMAKTALKYSKWTYMSMPKESRLKLMEEVDFKKDMGLLAKHPMPETIERSIWKEALKESKIKFESTPEFLFKGSRAFKESDWFDILSHRPSVPNTHFNGIVKEKSSILTESLVERLILLKDHPILNKEFIKNYINKKERVKKEEKVFREAKEIAKTQNEKELSKEITKLFSIGLGSKSNIEELLIIFKNGEE